MSDAIHTGFDFNSYYKPIIDETWGLAAKDASPLWERFYKKMQAKYKLIEHGLIVPLTEAVEYTEGGVIPTEKTQQILRKAFTIKNYANGVAFTKYALNDWKGTGIEKVKEGTGLLRATAMRKRNKVNYQLFNDGFDAAACGAFTVDGKAIWANDHVAFNAPAIDNLGATTTLSEVSLEDHIVAINLQKGYRGESLELDAEQLICHPSKRFIVDRILKSPLRVGTTDNDENAFKVLNLLQTAPIMSPFQTNTEAYVITTNHTEPGFVHYTYQGEEIDTEYSKKTKVYSIYLDYRELAIYASALATYGNAGA